MTKAAAEQMAASLNGNQNYALRTALYEGEEQRQKQGRSRLTARLCSIGYQWRSSISSPTRRALVERGLLTSAVGGHHLTPDGIKVARILFSREDIMIEDESAPGVVFQPKSVEEYVAWVLDRETKAEREHEARVKKVKWWWRGLKLDTWDGKKSVASQVEEHFADNIYNRRGLCLSLDDLEFLGEQIEAMREARS